MHLKFDMIAAYKKGIKEHPQEAMTLLGIKYQHATPQSLGDCWWFWNCKNIPEPLPEYLSDLNIADPHTAIGWGLSKEDADEIAAGE